MSKPPDVRFGSKADVGCASARKATQAVLNDRAEDRSPKDLAIAFRREVEMTSKFDEDEFRIALASALSLFPRIAVAARFGRA